MTNQQSLKERQRQEREALILRVAQGVLMERGYHDMSMSEIASRVGIAKGTLYQHFASKESLVLAIFKMELQGLQSLIEETATMQSDILAKFEYILRQMCIHVPGKRSFILSALNGDTALRSFLSDSAKDIYISIRRTISDLLDEGKAEGIFVREIPTEVMLNALFSLFALRLVFVQPEAGLRPGDFIRYLGIIYLRGIADPHVIGDDKFKTLLETPLPADDAVPHMTRRHP